MIDNKNKKTLLSLSPNKNLESDSNYQKYKLYLGESIGDTSLNNIAITGKYGSGKSSLVDTFLTDRKDYLRVSFATFDNLNPDSKSKNKDNNVFANIINQIIFQINPQKIPLTRFKTKRSLSLYTKIAIVLLVLLIISFTVNFGIQTQVCWKLFKLILAVLLSVYLIWNLLKEVEIRRIKFTFKNVETDIDMGSDDLFESEIDEIVYLFNNSGKKKLLIIEDLDRFNDLSIFEKLRELNTKLNYSSDTHWQFIYLLKDDLFVNANDRVKFFDKIIPIIPFITSNNSFDKLRELLPNHNSRLLRILGVYIDDFRLMLNIRNEFVVYSGDVYAENDELLALIAYKNLYPAKFDDLQNGKGELADTIRMLHSNIDNQINRLNDEIESLIEKKETTSITNEAEYLVVWALNNGLKFTPQFNAPNKTSISSVGQAKIIIKDNLAIGSGINGIPYNQYKDENSEYSEGLISITYFDSKLKNLKEQKKNLQFYKLKDLERSENIKIDDLLFSLIKNEFITSGYLNVVNHYYGESNNLIFMKKLFAQDDDYDFNMTILDHEGLYTQLTDEDYAKPQILNIDFTLWLIKKQDIDKFNLIVKLAMLLNNGFIETLLNKEPELYNNIIEADSEVRFDLTKLNPMNVNDIVNNNRYDNTEMNREKLLNWLVEADNNSLSSWLKLLNNVNIYSEFINLILNDIKQLNGVILLSELSNLRLWTLALNDDKARPTEDNVKLYYDEFGLDESLIEFMNRQSIEFSKELSDDFYAETLHTNSLSDSLFRNIWKRNENEVDLADAYELDNGKLKILVEMEKFDLNNNFMKMIYEKEIDLPEVYITHTLKEFIVNNETEISSKLVIKLLKNEDEINNDIFALYLNKLDTQFIKQYLDDHVRDGGKLNKILNKVKGYQSLKLMNDDVNKKILDWMIENKYIDSYAEETSDKIKPTFL